MGHASETAMSSSVLLTVIFLQGVWGTFFPPVSNPPPIPGQAVRTVDKSTQQLYLQEDLPKVIQQPIVKEGLFPSYENPDEQRWYLKENQSTESSEGQSSVEAFDRFYPDGEPAIGPVATPIPDDAYVAQPSTISKINPNEIVKSGPSGIWVLRRGSDNQYIPERWVQIEVPSERLIQVVNQESVSILNTDAVKSGVEPAPVEVPVKSQFTPGDIVQQLWVRSSTPIGPQYLYTNSVPLVEEVPSLKQIVEIPSPNVKQVVQQQISKDVLPVPPPPPPLPPTPVVASKSSFTVPPPPPPPLKGVDVPPTIVSSIPINIVPDGDFLTADKRGLPQIRHIWIPTSSRTGKFISVPVSRVVEPGKSAADKGIPLDPTSVAVSDTWVLKQDGPIPSFEQQKSVLTPPVAQTGKVVFQNPPAIPIDAISTPAIVDQYSSPKNAPTVGKSITADVALDIWPPTRDINNAKVLGKSQFVIAPEFPPTPPKTERVVLGKSFPVPPPAPQKTLVTSSKVAPLPPQPLLSPVLKVNGKPCPIPPPLPQKSLFPPRNPSPIAVPRIIDTQRKQLLTRIIRVNRYPSGNFYLLNSRSKPNIFTYPNPAFIPQSRSRIVRLVQTKIPLPVQSKPLIPLQTKEILVPLQPKQIPAPVAARQVVFPFSGRQVILPPAKLQNRIIYPGVQAIRYAYPWNAGLKSSLALDKRILTAQISSMKQEPNVSNSTSSSSESSSSETSSESSEEDNKDEKRKKEKKQKEKKEESGESDETERETDEAESKPTESKESASETQSTESIETSESQVTQTRENFANSDDAVRMVNKPYIFRFDHRDRNGTVQHRQEVSDTDGRVTGSYGYQDSDGIYRLAQYIADTEGYRVSLESNEPGTVSHESAHVNFISNQMTGAEEKPQFQAGHATDGSVTSDSQKD